MARSTRNKARPHSPLAAAFRPLPRARSGAILASAVAAALHGLAAAPAAAASLCGDPNTTVSDTQNSQCDLSGNSTLTVTETGKIQPILGTTVVVWGPNAQIFNHGTLAPGSADTVDNFAIGTQLNNHGTIEGGAGGSAVHNRLGASMALLNNTSQITAQGVFAVVNEGEIIQLNNSGIIRTNSYPSYAIGNFGQIRNLENDGTISSWGGNALHNRIGAGIDTVTNRNVMDGRLGAILNDGLIGELVNDGTLKGNTGALTNSATGTIGEIINRGTIQAIPLLGFMAAPFPSTDAIVNEGAITRGIGNYGLIDGNVKLGSAQLRLEGNTSRVTGHVSGGAGSSVVVNGQFTAENSFAVDSFTVASGARLNSQYYLFESRARPFSNQGQVYVQPGAVTTVVGDYVQSRDASLAVGVSSVVGTPIYGRLSVLGRASFEQGTGLYVDVVRGDALANQKVLTSVISATTLEATNDTFVTKDNSELFNFKTVVNADGTVDLRAVLDEGNGPDVIVRPPVKPDTPSVETPPAPAPSRAVSNRVSAQGFGQGMGAARVLDGLLANTGNTGDMADVVGAFGRLANPQQVADAVAQTLPLMSASLNQVSVNGMQGVSRVIQARQNSLTGLSSGEEFLADKHLWFKPLASYADQDNRNGVAGYRADTYGFVLGADAKVGEASRLGMAFSYARSDVKGKSTADTNSADIDAYQLMAYGSHALSAWSNAWVSWQADVGLNDNNGRRSMRFGGIDRVAKSDFDSTTAHLGAAIGRGFQLSDATSFTPSLRADYFRIHSESYKESGAGALDLRVGSQTSEQLITMVEGQLQHRLTDRAALVASLGVGYDMLGEGNSIAASYVGGGAAFQTPGMEPGRWIGRVGLGVDFQAAENTQITARYDVEARSGLAAQTASINLRWAF